MVESSQLVVSQGEIAVVPFHVRAGALEHVSERCCLPLQLVLLSQAPLTEYSPRRKQRCPEAIGQLTQRLALGDRLCRGHTIEVVRRHQRRVHSPKLREPQYEPRVYISLARNLSSASEFSR